MSTVSQTPPRPQLLARPAVRQTALAAALVAAVVLIAVGSHLREIAAMALAARPHLPDWALLARVPLAIQIHLGAALAALVLGAVLLTRRKGRTFHRMAGWGWVALVAATAGSSLFIHTLRPGHLSFLHVFTAWTLIVLPLGVMWARRHDVARHRRTMMGLFYGGFAINLFIAFIPGRLMWQALFG